MKELQNPENQDFLNEVHGLKELTKRLGLSNVNERESITPEKADELLTNRLDIQKLPSQSKLDNNFTAEKIPSVDEIKKIENDLKECNPNYNLGREWKLNCQRCVPTFEMRRRNYNVTALPRKPSEDLSDLAYDPFSVWKNPQVINCKGNGLSDIESNMSKWGDGARAEVVLMWKNAPTGHAFFAERINGETKFFDPQRNMADVSSYFKRAELGSVKICRVDNLEVTDKIKDCCRKV